MVSKAHPIILVIGNDVILNYLLGRFAEQSGYELRVSMANTGSPEIRTANPAVIIFPSIELLAGNRTFLMELAGLDTPIVVCSSVTEEARAIELGADYCLLHPITYSDFQAALAYTIAS